MPIYEYECASCRYYLEVMQKIADAPLKKCPSCGRNTLKKLISAPAFRLKGSGWYETDFKSDQERKRNLAAAEKDEAKSETKTESKAEAPAKAESKAADSAPPPKPPESSAGKRAEAGKSPAKGSARGASKKSARARPGKSAVRRKRR